MGYETLSLSSMFETKCYRQNDRSDRVIISWFWWKSEFGMVLTSQIYVLYTKHNLPIFFIIDLFLCKWWKIQALLPLWSCRRRSFSPQKVLPGKNNMSYLRKCDYTSGSSLQSSLEAFLGGSLRLKGSHLRCLRTKTSRSELSSGSRLSPGSGVRNCCSDPTSTRAGGQDDVS